MHKYHCWSSESCRGTLHPWCGFYQNQSEMGNDDKNIKQVIEANLPVGKTCCHPSIENAVNQRLCSVFVDKLVVAVLVEGAVKSRKYFI